MSTRSRIGIQLSDGSILSVYHHTDGYESWLGRILRTHYNNKELVTELIDGGDMSSAWTKNRWTFDGEMIEVEEYGPRYYVRKIDGKCPPRLDKNLTEYLTDGEEYAYLFINNQWKCYDLHGNLPEELEIPSGALAV